MFKNKQIQKKYIRRAKFASHTLLLTPFIRLVGLNGSLTRGEAKKTSDIDFFVVCKQGRIWTCRIFVILIIQLLGIRRHGNKIAGRICLNRYQTDDYLVIFPHDDYHATTFSKLWALINIDKTYEKYLQKNQWMEKMRYGLKKNEKYLQKNVIFSVIRYFGEMILSGGLGNIIEKKLGDYQKRRILGDIRTRNAPKGRIRVSDKELCFHPPKK